MKVVIVGGGKLGYKLATLISKENDVVLIDKNVHVIQRISEHLDILSMNANGLQIETLNEIRISTYDLIVAVTESDEKNMVICSIAKNLGCEKSIARVRDPEHVQQLGLIKRQMNIDHIVNPDLATSNEIFRYLVKPYAFHNEHFVSGKVGMVELNINCIHSIFGKKLKDLTNTFQDMLIVAISRNSKIIIPEGNTELLEDDKIFLIGEKEVIQDFSSKYNVLDHSKKVKKVLIMGGGKIGYYLSKKLSEYGVGVKIIEVDRERCKYLSENLDNVLILHGDGTDLSLLEEENIQSMDAFVALSGYDEENLLMSLMARQYGVDDVIAKVSRQNYIEIIEKLGINVAFNPVDIIASNILRFVQGRRLVAVSHLLQGLAEVIEIIAHEKMRLLKKPLQELNLPKGIIIGSIVRDGNVIIPTGNTTILANDRVVIFYRLSAASELEKFLKPKGGFLK